MDRQTLECREARQLIDWGVSPGSTRPERRALGFHLARCAACRAYRAQQNDTLLATLLDTPPCHTPPPSADHRRSPHPIRLIRTISLTLTGIAAVLALIFVGRMAVAFAVILGHVEAMTGNAGQTLAGSSPGTLPTELATLIPPTLPPPAWAFGRYSDDLHSSGDCDGCRSHSADDANRRVRRDAACVGYSGGTIADHPCSIAGFANDHAHSAPTRLSTRRADASACSASHTARRVSTRPASRSGNHRSPARSRPATG
jgi:hypothetical protein